MSKLANKVAFITGAGKGIGRGIAKLFAAEGCDLMLTSRTRSDLERVESELDKFDIEGLASRTGIDSPTAVRGLQEILPPIVEAFQDSGLSALASGGLIDKLKGVVGRFLGGTTQ